MRSFIRAHPVACYVALAFAISWGGILAVIGGGPIPAPPDDAHRLFALVYLTMLTGPSIAGLAMTMFVGGRTARRDYGARLRKWRVAPVWYAMALLLAPLALTFTLAVLAPLSSAFLPTFVGAGPLDSPGAIPTGRVGTILLVGVMVGCGAGCFEELGWTGFAVPSVLRRHGTMFTGLVVGVVWGAWHFLAVWWGSANAFGSVPVPLYLLVALFSFLPPYRLLMVHVYTRTGSVLVAMLMHASLTTSMIVLGPAVSGVDAIVYNLMFAAVLWLAVALVLGASRVRSAHRVAAEAIR